MHGALMHVVLADTEALWLVLSSYVDNGALTAWGSYCMGLLCL